jgi:nicotinamide phosphoribosyltransferase
MAAFSIPAAEHSSICAWGKENEVEAYRNMLRQFAKPGALVACVSDSYDLWNAITNLWGQAIKTRSY